VEVKLEMKKNPRGKSWEWDLVVQQWIGYKIKWKIQVRKVIWDMQDVEVVEGVTKMRSIN
jgi:hypothetical protein